MSYTWSRAAVPGIENYAGSGTGAVSDTLVNKTGSPVTVTYVFTLTEGSETNTQNVQVVVQPNPQMGFTRSNTTECIAGNSFTFTSTSTIASGSITKTSWYIGNSGAVNGNPVTYSFTTPGNFKVTEVCTTDQGCQAQLSQQVTVKAGPVAAFTYTLLPPYTGENYQFNNQSADATSGVTASAWNFGDGATSATVSPAHTYTGSGPFTASLTATNGAGCSTTITEPVILPVAAAGGVAGFTVSGGPASDPTGLCQGGAFTFTDKTAPAAGVTITKEAWNYADGNTGSGTGPITYTYTKYGYFPVTQVVTFSDGSTARSTQSVWIEPAWTLTLSPSIDQVVCSGSSSRAVYFIPANAGLSFNWTVSNSALGLTSGSGPNIPAVQTDSTSVSQSTTVTVNAVSPYGCPVTGQSFTVTENPVPNLTNGFPQVFGCNGQAITLPAFTSSLPATTFNWTNNNPVTGLGAAGTGEIGPFTGINYSMAATSSVVMVTPQAGGCTGSPRAMAYTVYPSPAITDSLKDTSLCSGSLMQYTGNPTLGANITWSRDSVAGVQPGTGSGGAAISERLTNMTPDPVTVPYIYTLSTATCTVLDTLNVNLGPTLSMTGPVDTALCSGTRFVYTPQSLTPGAAFTWTRAAVAGISNPAASGTGGVNESLSSTDTAAVNARYAYTVTADGCSSNVTVTLALEPIPTLTFPAGAGQTLCQGVASSPVDWAVTPYNTPVQWTNDNANIGLGQNGTGNIASFTAVDASTTPITGNLTATAQSAQGCSSGAVSGYAITVNPTPTATLDTPSGSLLCLGSSLPLTATGGATYQWSLSGTPIAGQAGPQLSATQPGLYTVTALSAQGCGDSAALTISYIAKPAAAFTFAAFCQDTPVVFTNASTETGGIPVTWQWTDNAGHSSTAADPVFTYPVAGNYRVSLVATPDGCPGLADSAVAQLAVQQPPAGSNLPSVFAQSNKPTNITAPGYSGASYLWTPATGLSSQTVISPVATVAGPQIYFVTITLASGCVTTDTLQVNMIAPDVVYIPTGFTPNGDGHNDLFVIAGLNNYPGSGLLIFNRWGSKVYESTSYANDWDGGGNPPGTYVYVLQLKVGENAYLMKKGWLEIMK